MTTTTLRTSRRQGRLRGDTLRPVAGSPALPPAGKPAPRYQLRCYLLQVANYLLETLEYMDLGSFVLDTLLDVCYEAYFLTLVAQRPPQVHPAALWQPTSPTVN
jgi:hypothetical protein